MMASPSSSPIIFLGMHRSGTTMVAESLRRLGLFMGTHRDRNCESWFFVRANSWVLRQARAHWTQPLPIFHLLNNPKLFPLARDQISEFLNSPRYAQYRGLGGLLGVHRGPPKGIWGWKDPRNTFTLPLWLSIFPDARVIHIRRHGVDVAQSLMNRHNNSLSNSQKRLRRKRHFYKLGFLPRNLGNNPRCATLEGAFSLWEEYLAAAEENLPGNSSQALDIPFEEILQNPRPSLQKLVDFCGMEPPSKELDQSARDFEASRAFAYRSSPQLQEFSQKVSPQLALHGYNDL